MQFTFLADHEEAIPLVARWYFDEWACHVEGATFERSVERLRDYLNRDRLPFVRLAMDGCTVVGAAQLKLYEMKDIYPDKEHWIGGVFVSPSFRGKGIGAELVLEIVRLAPLFGVRTLYLQTQRFDGGLYTKLGWQSLEQVRNGKVEVLVMEKGIAA